MDSSAGRQKKRKKIQGEINFLDNTRGVAFIDTLLTF
jgi:hypothetical protein